MTIVQTYMTEHHGEEWFNLIRIPIVFFVIFELILVSLIATMSESKLSEVLQSVGIYGRWLLALLAGSMAGFIGLMLRHNEALCKYHVTSTSQLVNSIAWGVAGFVVLDTAHHTALAVGMFMLSVVNVFFAIVGEGWGSRTIKA